MFFDLLTKFQKSAQIRVKSHPECLKYSKSKKGGTLLESVRSIMICLGSHMPNMNYEAIVCSASMELTR